MSEWAHHVIARRELRRAGSLVVVSIGLPYQQETITWYAPFRIEGIEVEPFHHAAGGSDSAQALILCLKMIAAVLNSWNSDHSITWNGDPDLGFPS
ncbi:DUF6968 family protein [Nocardia veterana]|uniref:DUF6968 domain-containing protein n=1 Tax=Nocardia veterana TaxID=132249 RepID=A0A7X6RLL1_9NOCA|nr:hypothetical protein [Nocardia veterana]NKY89888.1 hypothetical protein [Nocardia veterana]